MVSQLKENVLKKNTKTGHAEAKFCHKTYF